MIGFQFRGNLWGPGPAYPMLSSDPNPGTTERPVLVFKWPPPEGWGTEWSGSKVLWVVDRRVRKGRILVRGRQVGGPNEIRFQDGRPGFTLQERLNPARELRIEEEVRDQPATTRIRTEGCYSYQVDGRTFSYLIVFQAQLIG